MIQHDLQELLGADAIVDDSAAHEPYLTEWRDRVRGAARLIVRPRSTEQVATLVRYCADNAYSVVPQGGNTGLCGGAIPSDAERSVLVSLARMNAIENVSPDDNAMTVQAGCTLSAAQEAARDVGRYFPLSLAAEGSATIGGNISTDAGGVHVLRYGTARDLVLGLEVVLADGTVWNGLRRLRKNTAGYDARHWFIGAEGTLGIITRAELKLFPQPEQSVTVFCSVDSVTAALALYHRLDGAIPNSLQSFELISRRALDFVLAHIPSTRTPLDTKTDYYVLAEFAGGRRWNLTDTVQAELADALNDGCTGDVAVASSLAQSDAFWRLRHSISEAQKPEGASLKHDIALPLSKLADFHADTAAALEALCPGIRPVIFGHIGDGNLHYNLTRPTAMNDEAFRAQEPAISACVYEGVARYAGTVSAEHGIGVFKQDLLREHVSGVEYALMERVKSALDPAGTMNPGKVVAGGIAQPKHRNRSAL
ncbi:MAG: FAD-binding oxidoreductase [Pseudomonadota bacterium]